MRVSSVWVVAALVLCAAAACSDGDDDNKGDAATGKPRVRVGAPKGEPGSGQSTGKDGKGPNGSDDEDGGGGALAPGDHGNDDEDGGREPTIANGQDAGHSFVVDAGGVPPVVLPVVDITYDGPAPAADKLPTAKGECPVFAGDNDYTFNVQGGRTVFIGVDASKAPADGPGGPIIFYWHGTNGSPFEAGFGLGGPVIDAVKNQGGLVAGFYSTMNWPDKGACEECRTNTGNGVWFTEDFNLADEVLACAIAQLHIDTRRIHTSGMSAGGLQATAMLYARSNYLASAAPYSGGVLLSRRSQDATNIVPAMIFHGTYDDDVVGIHFYSTSKTLFDDIKDRGGFAIDCNHGGAHIIPGDGGPAVWMFFQYHPYRTAPSPWAEMLPSYLPSYCSLTFQAE